MHLPRRRVRRGAQQTAALQNCLKRMDGSVCVCVYAIKDKQLAGGRCFARIVSTYILLTLKYIQGCAARRQRV